MCKIEFSWHPEATKCQILGAAILFSQINMKKIHDEATEVHICTFSNRAWQKLTSFFNSFFVFFNMAKFGEILTHFPQVMVSQASATNYDA